MTYPFRFYFFFFFLSGRKKDEQFAVEIEFSEYVQFYMAQFEAFRRGL
jgi:hypothetical protein